MPKRRYLCDKCGVQLDKKGELRNGLIGKMRFRIAKKTKSYEEFLHCYSTVVMCPACWAEFEKVYREFMVEKEQSK